MHLRIYSETGGFLPSEQGLWVATDLDVPDRLPFFLVGQVDEEQLLAWYAFAGAN